MSMMKLTAAVVHLGNVAFGGDDDSGAQVAPQSVEVLELVCGLTRIPIAALTASLTTKVRRPHANPDSHPTLSFSVSVSLHAPIMYFNSPPLSALVCHGLGRLPPLWRAVTCSTKSQSLLVGRGLTESLMDG